MTTRIPRLQRLSTAARWPVGIAWTAWRYVWRTMPVHRWELSGSWEEDAGPSLPESVELDGIQQASDGAGALFHRIYRTSIRESSLSAAELMARIAADLDELAPAELAKFQKVRGEDGKLRVGDEYVVRIPGPWDGPVRVIAVDEHAFRLATTSGHLEAGQIEFRAYSSTRSIEFVIESWARSGSRLSNVLYAHLRMAKEVQLHMWTSVLERVTSLAQGKMDGGVRVITRRVDEDPDEATPRRRRSRRRLAELAGRAVNFDASRAEEYRRSSDWHVDDLSEALPDEPSGEPVEGGSFVIAQQLMHDYQLADPGRVRAIFDRDRPLEGRDMLLQLRFLVFRIHVGVRIGAPYDEIRVVDGRRVRVFGWSYRTLEGHVETGEMHYEVWKWLEEGDVEFRLHAYSKPSSDPPLWLRMGFAAFGRRQQRAYYRSSCRMMRRLTESQLELADVRRREERALRAGRGSTETDGRSPEDDTSERDVETGIAS